MTLPGQPDPPVRVDRFWFQELELYLAEAMLQVAATMVDGIGKGGTIYPNIILPPDEAARKAQMEAAR